MKTFQVGRYSSTTVALMYIRGVADKQIVDRLCRKIEKIDVDGIVDSAYVLSFIQTKKNSFFIQAGTTEKPDVATAKLLEGRVVIIVDGSPIAITLPYLVFEDVQDGYDYYSGDWRASMIRMFRMFGAMLTVLLPAAYISLQTYHFQLLPIKFLMTLMAAMTNIPFPPAIEMLIVLTLFEVLNQASIRMPRYFGISRHRREIGTYIFSVRTRRSAVGNRNILRARSGRTYVDSPLFVSLHKCGFGFCGNDNSHHNHHRRPCFFGEFRHAVSCAVRSENISRFAGRHFESRLVGYGIATVFHTHAKP